MSTGRVLVVAGSDSSGGAGLEADQKTLAAHKCYAMTATTALTAQNTLGVEDIHVTPPAFLRKQIELCLDDIGADAIKTGMLASAETVEVVADTLRKYAVPHVVIDPVMVATTGAQLLPENAVRALREKLLPLATLLTPNIPEARLLLKDAGHEHVSIESLDDLKRAAKMVQALGPRYVLLKGGHLPLAADRSATSKSDGRRLAVDVLCGPDGISTTEVDFLESKNTHGTGDSLASSIAAGLAQGLDMKGAVKAASRFVEAGIKTSKDLGRGNGPINHFHSTYRLPFAPGHFVDYILEREDVKTGWKEHTEHEFVQRLAADTLSEAAFKHYLIQDYLFLIQFARANALASYKAKNLDDIGRSATIVKHIQTETKLHLDYCAEFGLSQEEIAAYEEDQACTAYTRYVLDIGQSEDWFALQVALAPCLLGYGFIARRLFDDPKTKREGNRYWKWIQNYVEEDFVEAVRTGSDILEQGAVKQSPSRIEELVAIFIHATKMETGFWDMGLKAGDGK